MYPGEEMLELLDNGYLEINKPEHVADVLDCQGEQNNEDDNADGPTDDQPNCQTHYVKIKYISLIPQT